jgi:hypothetical protein
MARVQIARNEHNKDNTTTSEVDYEWTLNNICVSSCQAKDLVSV